MFSDNESNSRGDRRRSRSRSRSSGSSRSRRGSGEERSSSRRRRSRKPEETESHLRPKELRRNDEFPDERTSDRAERGGKKRRSRSGKQRRRSKSSRSSRESERGALHQALLSLLGRQVDREDHRANALFLRKVGAEIQPFVFGILLFLSVVLTGAGTTPLSQGILLVGIALSLLILPSVHRVTGILAGLLSLLCVWALHGWFPMNASADGSWRNIYLLDSASGALPILGPNWANHLVAWVLLVAGVSWLRWILSWRLSGESVHAVLWLLSVAVAALSAGVMLGNAFGWRLPFAQDPDTFSYFPNRNQTSILLAVGAFIAIGKSIYHGIHFRLFGFGVGAILSLICMSGVFQMHSRGGVLFLFLGLLVFTLLAGIAMRRTGAVQWLKVGLPGVIFLIATFTVLDGQVRDRLVPLIRGDFSGFGDDFRYAVWADAFKLISAEPLGIGLGQFDGVFPQYLEAAVVGKEVLHPESSWLWVLSELGWVGLGLVVLLFVFLVFQAIKSQIRFPNPVRLLSVVALGMLFGHSLVDVGWHRPGIWMLGFLLVGTVYRPNFGVKLRAVTRLSKWIHRSGALIFLLVGIGWISASIFTLPLHPGIISESAQEEMAFAVSERDPAGVLEVTDLWIATQPLSWEAHFAQGSAYLRAGGQRDDIAVQAFRMARELQPHLANLGMLEGQAWLASGNVGRAFNAWRWMLGTKSENDDEILNQLFEYVWSDSNGREQLILLSEVQPKLRLKVYDRVDLQTLTGMIEGDLEAEELGYPFWQLLTAERRLQWARTKGWEEFQAFVMRNPSFASLLAQWPFRFEGYIGDTKFRDAAKLFESKVLAPNIPGELEGVEVAILERQYRNTPDDSYRGYLLAKQYLEMERNEDALYIFNELRNRGGKVPPFAHYWEGVLLLEADQPREAVEAWSRWILASNLLR